VQEGNWGTAHGSQVTQTRHAEVTQTRHAEVTQTRHAEVTQTRHAEVTQTRHADMAHSLRLWQRYNWQGTLTNSHRA
jgi:hypothetical protein